MMTCKQLAKIQQQYLRYWQKFSDNFLKIGKKLETILNIGGNQQKHVKNWQNQQQSLKNWPKFSNDMLKIGKNLATIS